MDIKLSDGFGKVSAGVWNSMIICCCSIWFCIVLVGTNKDTSSESVFWAINFNKCWEYECWSLFVVVMYLLNQMMVFQLDEGFELRNTSNDGGMNDDGGCGSSSVHVIELGGKKVADRCAEL